MASGSMALQYAVAYLVGEGEYRMPWLAALTLVASLSAIAISVWLIWERRRTRRRG